ncbi:MAG: hypothetical protein A3C90_01040 [Candidatus Magasanikbacteria bacterium RIFCSPHIGHO2_02_FULL_51_14]|uniref:Uncharacterized protein n=1 Tax=Candidatus Magasanikbacteria bacterium RIFCSPHIGHO2_02_FULL_51_14 TaxID=1798683 RepID=A0A1F6MFJ7_9BACT|nr:MAG: hypothetical protein A3C90_01040 [Candidatus Magasanikbacteria bacterium RIFCSPHIGHO2_02_FULL_51_14]
MRQARLEIVADNGSRVILRIDERGKGKVTKGTLDYDTARAMADCCVRLVEPINQRLGGSGHRFTAALEYKEAGGLRDK